MSWVAIKDALQALLESVTGIGLVHDYVRRINNDADLRALGVVGGGTGVINLWMHSQIGFTQPLLTTMEKEVQRVWMIRGYYSLSDGNQSEYTFQALVENIANGIGADIQLGGACEYIRELVSQVPSDIPHVLLPSSDGGVLCHFADLRMVIQDRLDR